MSKCLIFGPRSPQSHNALEYRKLPPTSYHRPNKQRSANGAFLTMLLAFKALVWLFLLSYVPPAIAFANSVGRRSKLVQDLQKCVTPEQVLEATSVSAAKHMKPSIASLVLVRLSKQLVERDNNQHGELLSKQHLQQVRNVAARLAVAANIDNVEALTEGTKAYSVLLRLMQEPVDESDALIQYWNEYGNELASRLEPHHLSGLKWSFDVFDLLNKDQGAADTLPSAVQEAHDDLKLPFTIIPGCLQGLSDLSVETITSQVDFRVDDIRTSSNTVVKERRQTEWQGDVSSGPFVYSSKSMLRSDWSPIVKQVRDCLYTVTNQYYDGCLLNLYHNGQSVMRYHIDPDQGTLRDYDTAVVSVGATRRFCFRSIDMQQQQRPHNFLVMHGDVAYMFDDCQERFQHTVKKADNRMDESSRASLVFKRTWNATNAPL